VQINGHFDLGEVVLGGFGGSVSAFIGGCGSFIVLLEFAGVDLLQEVQQALARRACRVVSNDQRLQRLKIQQTFANLF